MPAVNEKLVETIEVKEPVREGAPMVLNTRPLFKLMVERKASDLFFTSNSPIKVKIEGAILPINKQILTPGDGAPGGLRAHDARPARELQARAGNRLRDLRARPRPLPRQRVLPARLSRDGAALHQRRHAEARPARAARHVQGPHHDEARAHPDGGRHRLRQVHVDRGDDQPSQRESPRITS